MYLKNRWLIKLPLLLCLFAGNVPAADPVSGQNRSLVCQGCHGYTGSNKNQGVPNLAGQSAAYQQQQARLFLAGFRENSSKKAVLSDLNDQDLADIAAYFAAQPAASAGGDPALAARGKPKAVMCAGCHGESFRGGAKTPRLAGQHPEYLIKQLRDYRGLTRSGPPMNAMAKTLSDADIDEIAAYLGSLPP